ncbi:MAG: T9SS type A sorting domain-containing protein [Bacteroidota bacterium]
MKTIFTLVLCMCLGFMSAQNSMFVHTATAGNISADASFITHPDLDGNPNAKILVTHTWNPPGSGGVYNQEVTGVFYSNGENQWGVYNESGVPMTVGSSYNIYIAQGPGTVLHVADIANQGSVDSYSIVNHPDLNGNPNARLLLTTYYNENGVRNNHNYGVWYDDNINRWIIFSEDFQTIPLDSAFFITVEPDNAQTVKHVATAGNISGNWTAIDHPLLNNNPDGIVLITHNWGISGASSNVVLDKALGVWYTGVGWAIYVEDQSAMPLDIEFDIMIFDPPLGVENSTIEGLTYFPNPVQDLITIDANKPISRVTVFDILGKQVMQQNGELNSMKINMSALTTGNYLAKVEAGDAVQVIKLIKQ